MKQFATLLLACGLSAAAQAQISITAASPTYFQNFNSLDTGATNSSNLPANWKIAEAGTSTSANGQYRSGNGSGNAGDTYSFGATQNTERALGSLASNSLQPHFGAAFVNNTGSAIGSMTVSYRCEQWRAGDTSQRPDSLRFFYSLTAADIDTTLTGWTEVVALMGNSAQLQGNGVALDGNTIGTNVSGTVNVAIPAGATFRIKWVDKNIVGTDDALALDSLTVSFTSVVPNLRPVITSLTPADGATGVPATTTSLQMTFNKPVTKGTGNIHLHNTAAGTMQMIDVTSSGVTVSGSTVTISGISLLPNTAYHVMVDSTAFDSSGYRFVGIYDNSTWNFNTAPTSVATVAASRIAPAILGRATTDRIAVGFTAAKAEEYTLALYAINGREVIRQTVRATAGENQVVIQPRGIAVGQYILRVSSASSVGSVKATVE